MTAIVTRFAPSPTGRLHLGHAYAALFAQHRAREGGGRFLLRIEDIDRSRCRPEFEAGIFEDLAWLGLQWETPVRRQSDHTGDYRAALDALASRGLLYPCFCSRKEIQAEIAAAVGAPQGPPGGGPEGPLYPGTCRELSDSKRAARMKKGEAYALRLDVSKAKNKLGSLTFTEWGAGPDGEHGEQLVRPELLGDVVLARKDMPASYHLAVVVDDARQGMTLVVRGIDLFHATHIQRLLQAVLGLPTPAYQHHPLILDAEGKKFSKRDQSMTLRALRDGGATPKDIRTMVGITTNR